MLSLCIAKTVWSLAQQSLDESYYPSTLLSCIAKIILEPRTAAPG